jgi:hypothetical protein
MDPYQRQQFDLLLATAGERLAERIVQRCAGAENALARLRADPQGEGIWLDQFVDAIFQDFLLDSPAGACFVLQALHRRPAPPPDPGSIEAMLQQMARRAFADLLHTRTIEVMEQAVAYG